MMHHFCCRSCCTFCPKSCTHSSGCRLSAAGAFVVFDGPESMSTTAWCGHVCPKALRPGTTRTTELRIHNNSVWASDPMALTGHSSPQTAVATKAAMLADSPTHIHTASCTTAYLYFFVDSCPCLVMSLQICLGQQSTGGDSVICSSCFVASNNVYNFFVSNVLSSS
jgi:hypothetical protein